MILKGLDKQGKENNTLIYSSRNPQNKNNKGTIDRRNLLKLNFSFVTPSKDNRLNRSLNTLPKERNLFNSEIEEDIIVDSNSVNNVNINSEEKKFYSKMENININQDKLNNIKINSSIEIDKKLISNELVKDDNNYNDKDNNNDIQEDKRENALNTIMYNMVGDNKTKNEKINISDKNGNINNDDEQINKSLEEEHNFDIKEEQKEKEDINDDEKKEEKEKEETDDVNYDFDDGDNIIDIDADYEKI